MALISKIRNNSWLLVVVIGLGLVSFIAMDMTSSGNNASAGDMSVGMINGEGIDYKEFQNTEQILYSGGTSNNTFGNRDYLWNYFVEKTLVGQYAEKLGLGVSRDELMELQFGNNLSPVISQRFVNQTTGQIDRQSLNSMKSRIESDQMDPRQIEFWRVQEKEIIARRIQAKVNTMVSKGIYTPTWMAEVRNAEQSATINFDYLKIPLSEVDDAEVTVSDAEIQTYLNTNKALYKQNEETRVAEYVMFDILPTKQDSTDIFEKLVDLKKKLAAAKDDSTFVVNHNGIYNVAYLKEAQVNPVLKDTLFDLPIGSMYGPFLESGQYKVIKLIDRKVLPDSVKSRHILRRVQTQEEFFTANTLIDSLIKEIKAGTTDFAAAAAKYGTDGSASTGGDLGYAVSGGMVKPFNDMIFYQAEVGELNKVVTQYGLHLVEVTDKKFITKDKGVKYSTLFENIMPSQETQTVENDRIFDFISENNSMEKLRTALVAQGKSFSNTPLLKQNDYRFPVIGTSSTARELIRWVFTPGIKEGEISPEVYSYKDPNLFYNSKLILMGLKEINEGDMPSVASLRDRIEPLVRNEKKAAQIATALSGMDMSAAASKYGQEVKQATNVGLASGSVPGIGNEPKLVGQAFLLGNGESAGPIAGRDGVYYINVTAKNEAPAITDLAAKKNIYTAITKGEVPRKLWEAVKSEQEIEDKRYIYY